MNYHDINKHFPTRCDYLLPQYYEKQRNSEGQLTYKLKTSPNLQQLQLWLPIGGVSCVFVEHTGEGVAHFEPGGHVHGVGGAD